MKKRLTAILIFIAALNCSPLFAEPFTLSANENVIALDDDRTSTITRESIAQGHDDIFLRKATQLEIQKLPVNSVYFVDEVGNNYLPLTYQDLRKSDVNSDRRLDNKDPMFAGLYIGRFVPGSKENDITLVPLRELGISALILPAAVPAPDNQATRIEAVTSEGSLILIQATPWKF